MSQETVEVRPDAAAYWAGLRRRAVVLGVIAVAGCLRIVLAADSWTGRLISLLAIGVLVGGLSGLVWTHLARSVVRLRPDAIEYRAPLFRDRTLALGPELRGGVVALTRPLQSSVLVLALAEGRRRPRLQLTGVFWSAAALEQIATHAGVAGSASLPRRMSGMELEELAPGSTRFAQRRPWTFAWLMAALIIAVVVAGMFGYYRLAGLAAAVRPAAAAARLGAGAAARGGGSNRDRGRGRRALAGTAGPVADLRQRRRLQGLAAKPRSARAHRPGDPGRRLRGAASPHGVGERRLRAVRAPCRLQRGARDRDRRRHRDGHLRRRAPRGPLRVVCHRLSLRDWAA